MARIGALLRRPRQPRSPTPRGLEVDGRRRRVAVDGRSVALTPLEFDLLAVLAREPGVVVSRGAIMREVWGPGYD
ncbi:MAG: winged helix-turn-helix domain-containing protein, partial [Actinomycetes bacterium]